MGQYWYLTNLDSEQYKVGGKLGESFCGDRTFVDMHYFVVPTWSEDKLSVLCRKFPRTTHRSKSPASRLLRLSDELLTMVFGYVEDIADAACFCLADGRLLSIGFTRLGELHKLEFAPWAGDRVICLGDGTEDDDYPISIQEHVSEYLDDEDDRSEYYDESREFIATILEHFKSLRWPPNNLSRERRLLSRDMKRAEYRAIQMLVHPQYDSTHPWVLCNLSKHEYVRADAIAGITDSEDEVKDSTPFLSGPISLGQALLSRICWSSSSSIAMSYEGDLHRGPWAGNRFEVTTMDKLGAGDWRDISAEVADILPKIWDAEYGDDSWRTRNREY